MDKFLFIDFGGVAPAAGVLEGKKAYIIQSKSRNGISLLAKVLKMAGKNLRGIIAVTGPGSFSSVRGTALAANLLSELLGVPVCGITRRENENAKGAARRCAAVFRSGKKSKYILPHYYAEPNITAPKDAGFLKIKN